MRIGSRLGGGGRWGKNWVSDMMRESGFAGWFSVAAFKCTVTNQSTYSSLDGCVCVCVCSGPYCVADVESQMKAAVEEHSHRGKNGLLVCQWTVIKGKGFKVVCSSKGDAATLCRNKTSHIT